ncbi:MAG: hypothetical protein ACPG7F_02980 [Aggregatilineales bacterium]
MQNTLTYLVYGKAMNDDGHPVEHPTVLAQDTLTETDAYFFQQEMPLLPRPADHEAATRAIALMRLPANGTMTLILAGAYYHNASEDHPVYRYIALMDDMLERGGTDLNSLASLAVVPVQAGQPINPPILPPPATWTPQRRAAYLDTLLSNIAGGEKTLVLAWLAAALSSKRVLVRPTTLDKSLSLVEGLMMLLPPGFRSQLTFSTYNPAISVRYPAILFSPAEDDGTRWRITSTTDIDPILLEQPFIAHLATLWQSNILDFVASLRDLDRLAEKLLPQMPDADTLTQLNAITARHQQDIAVMGDTPVDIAALIATLHGDTQPSDELHAHYIRRLLDDALETRDADAFALVATALDDNPGLTSVVNDIFTEALNTQPDAVYVFARTRLSKEFDEDWLTRLHEAAKRSLDVAISSGDTPTLISWLELIAREPGRYNLKEILHGGLLTARERVGDEDSALARQLLTLAVKRDPELIPTLLNDGQMNIALDKTLSYALQGDSAAIEQLAQESRELFLLTVAEANNRDKTIITPAIVRSLWEMYRNPGGGSLASVYRPGTQLNALATVADGDVYLDKTALEMLLTLTLAAGDDDLFYKLTETLPQIDHSGAALATALEQSGHAVPEIMTLVNTLSTQDKLNAWQMVNICATLLTNRDWDSTTLPLSEKLARTLHNNPEIDMLSGMLWKMLDVAAAQSSEMMARLATRRLLQDIGDTAIETGLVDALERLYQNTRWSEAVNDILPDWWRQFTDTQSMGQLHKYERALSEKKHVDILHAIVQTTIAMRRALGQQGMAEFSDAIATTYNTLQALADAFPSGTRQNILLDRETLRDAINRRSDDIEPDVQQVLATNLRELSQLVATISDQRSKPSLLGPGADDLERALLRGEHPPTGAIDMMKFISGYIEGTHRNDDDEDER